MKPLKQTIAFLFSISLFFSCCPSKPVIEGCYNTQYYDKINDTVKLYQSNVPMQLSRRADGSIDGTWTSDGQGRIYGTFDQSGRIINGTWKTTNFEGKIKFIFDDNSNFEGFWTGTTPRGTVNEWLRWDGTKTTCETSKK